MKKDTQSVIFGSGRVGSKGQIVIPVDIRKDLNISQGETLVFIYNPSDKGFMVMKPEEMLTIQKEFEAFNRKLQKERIINNNI